MSREWVNICLLLTGFSVFAQAESWAEWQCVPVVGTIDGGMCNDVYINTRSCMLSGAYTSDQVLEVIQTMQDTVSSFC